MEAKQLKSFKDLMVWQKAATLATTVYEFTRQFPQSELYGITSQMRRAAVSVSSNIAEGFKRSHKKEKLQFYNIASASATELESQLEIAKKLEFLNEACYKTASVAVVEVGKMLNGLIKSPSFGGGKSITLSCFLIAASLYSIFFILNPNYAGAADLYFQPKELTVGTDSVVSVDVLMDSPEGVNALEGTLVFPEELLDFQDISDGNTIINFWVQRPTLVKPGEIYFAGIIPGGFGSQAGKLFSIQLAARKPGQAQLSIKDILALLNDGEGTKTPVTVAPAKIIISGELEAVRPPDIEDRRPPEEFTPIISREETLFDNQYFVVFVAQDKGTGVDHYEIAEVKKIFRPRPSTVDWQAAESPAVLRDQSLQSWILVKAVDQRGNEQVAFLEPVNFPFYKRPSFIIGLIVLLLLAAGFLLWRRPQIRGRARKNV